MLRKLPIIIAIEIIIGVTAFLLAGDKAQFGEIVFMLIVLTLIISCAFYGFKRFLISR